MVRFSWTREGENKFRIRIRTSAIQEGTFHRLTVAIYALRYNILSGRLDTVEENGEVLTDDELLLEKSPERTGAPEPADDATGLGVLMESLLREEKDPQELLEEKNMKLPGPALFFEASPEMIFVDLPEADLTQFYLETYSRRGLLCHLSRVLSQRKINIIRAEISTNENGQTEDTFYLQQMNHKLEREMIRDLEKAIRGND